MPRLRRGRSLIVGAVIAGAVSVGNAIALPLLINVATGGDLPTALEPYRRWAFPLVGAWTLIGFVVAGMIAVRPATRDRDYTGAGAPLIRRASNLRPRNRHFTGRVELLDQVRRNLDRGGPVAVVARPWIRPNSEAQALHGMPGVGKTELALEYAHRYHDSYDIAWWVDASDTTRLTSQLSTLAVQLGLAGQRAEERYSAVLAELGRRNRWLLVYDNVADPADILEYLPGSTRGHVVLTSRFRSWDAHATPIRVNEFTEDEAVTFLVRRLPGTSDADADALAAELGRLPLALAHAAAYAQQRGIGVDRYLTLYRAHQPEMLAAEAAAERYPLAVRTTLKVAFDEIEARSVAAWQLMLLYAQLAPDEIPNQLLAYSAEVLPQPLSTVVQNELDMLDTIGLLHAYSLIEHDDGMVRVHRLVQAVSRSLSSPAERRQWLSYAVGTLERAVQADEALRPALVTHVLMVADHQAPANA